MNKDYIVAGLKKQRSRLETLIREFESKAYLEPVDFRLYDEITKQVEKDMGSLRKEGVLFRQQDAQTDLYDESN